MNKNKYKLFNKNNNAFTLVELIIVITILAILATIAFISFQNYSGNARDSNRLSTIKNIETGLELFTLKTSQFPTPDEAKIYTGGTDGKSQINQGIIGESVVKIISLSNIPLDPKDKTHYVYSTFGNSNKYYQVGINSENSEVAFIPQTYANSRTSIVKGNYRFDPILPSLIVVENEALTNSGIFSPDICFIMNNGKNSLHECNEKKFEMNLKDYDDALVGYWDMESITNDGKLKDLSGNENHGAFSGNILPISTGGLLGHAFTFIDSNKSFIDIESSPSLESHTGKITIQAIFKANKNEIKGILTKQSSGIGEDTNSGCSYTNYCGYQLRTEINGLGGRVYDTTPFGYINSDGNPTGDRTSTGIYNNYVDNFIYLTYIIKAGETGDIYLNGQKILPSSHQILGDISVSKNNLRIGRYWNDRTGNQNYQDFDGTIDDVKIYTRALTEEEILQQAKIAGF